MISAESIFYHPQMYFETDFEINLMLLYLQSVFEKAISDGCHMRE